MFTDNAACALNCLGWDREPPEPWKVFPSMAVTSRDVEMISGFVPAAEGAAHQGLSPGFPGCCFLTNLRLELLPAPEANPKFPLLLKPAPSCSEEPGHGLRLEEHKGISSFSFTRANYFLDSLSLTGFLTSFLPGLRYLSLPRDNLNVQIPSSSNLVEENVPLAL